MKEYWTRLRQKLSEFTREGDALELQGVTWSDDPHVCGLCGYNDIRWLHRLANLRTGQTLIVGSKCIGNYKRVHDEIYETPLRIRASASLARIVEKINSQKPGTIEHIGRVHSSEVADLDDSYDEDDEDIEDVDDLDPDEESAEGTGRGEIDWDNPGTLPDEDGAALL
jgi:hypothetical protein